MHQISNYPLYYPKFLLNIPIFIPSMPIFYPYYIYAYIISTDSIYICLSLLQ